MDPYLHKIIYSSSSGFKIVPYNTKLKNYWLFDLKDQLIGYDSKSGFVTIKKIKYPFLWLNEIVKLFRYIFYPQFRIKTVLEGLKIEIKKIQSEEDKYTYLRVVKTFKEKVVDRHNQRKGFLRTVFPTEELDRELTNLVEKSEIDSPLREEFKKGISTGTFALSNETLPEFIKFAIKYKLLPLSYQCLKYIHTLTDLITRQGLTIDQFNVICKFYQELCFSQNSSPTQNYLRKIKDLIDGAVRESPYADKHPKNFINSESDFKKLIIFAKNHNFSYLLEQCKKEFDNKYRSLFKKSVDLKIQEGCKSQEGYKKILETAYTKKNALLLDPNDFSEVLNEALDLGFDQEAKTIYEILIENCAHLCLKITFEELENQTQVDPKLAEGYFKVLQEYSFKMKQFDPNNCLFLGISLLFDNTLFCPHRGLEVFRNFFSLFIWDYPEYASEKIKNQCCYLAHNERFYKDFCPKSRITDLSKEGDFNLTISEIITIYSDAIKVANHPGFNGLKIYFLDIISPSLVFKKLEKELPSLPQNEKDVLIDLVRTLFYPILTASFKYSSFRYAQFIIDFEKFLTIHSKKHANFQFNDVNTHNVKLKLPNDIIMHLHREILKKSHYFKSLFDNNMKEATQSEIFIDEPAPAFIDLLKYLYTNEVEITEENILAILILSEKYQIESKAFIKSLVYRWVFNLIIQLKNSLQEGDSISLEIWSSFLEFDQIYGDHWLSQDIYEYIILSINQYLLIEKENFSNNSNTQKSLNITLEIFKERQSFLEKNIMHLDRIHFYDLKIKPLHPQIANILKKL